MTERTEYEPTPENEEVDYERYREIADTLNPAFRKTGIVDPGGYDRAMRDPRTVRLRIGEGLGVMEMPFLTPIEHVAGYDVERTKKLTGKQDVLLMTLPMVALTDAEIVASRDEHSVPDRSAILIETEHGETDDIKQTLPSLLAELGPHQPADFLDKRIEKPELQAATMAMYKARFTAANEQGEQLPRTNMSFHEAYEQLLAEGHELTKHTRLLDVQQLRESEAMVNELWDLCKDRFDWLGDAHPVSMEDTKEFFDQLVLNDNTLVRYDENGKMACLGFFMSGMDECDWVKDSYSEGIEKEAEAAGDQVIYFYGIASNSTNAMHYSRDVVQLLSHITKRMGGTFLLVFESTNMSGQYIPDIVMDYIGKSDGVRVTEPVKKDSQVDYWYLKPVTAD